MSAASQALTGSIRASRVESSAHALPHQSWPALGRWAMFYSFQLSN